MTPGLAVEQAQAILDAANRMPAAPALQPRHAPTNLGRCRTCPNPLTSADAWNRCNACLKGGL